MYGTVDDVRQRIDPTRWDPSRHDPNTATVLGLLADWSDVLDQQISVRVMVPVEPDVSPKLFATCRMATLLRVSAEVFDQVNPTSDKEMVGTRASAVWRNQADDLVQSICDGAIADGLAVGGHGQLDVGTPAAGATGSPRFGMGQKF